MTIRHFGAVSAVALIAACSQQHAGPQMSATDAAYAAFRAGDYARAEQGYGAVLASDPTNAAALLGMGEVLEASGRTSEALSYYRRAEAAQAGAIRVFNGEQQGVTELAYRRLGELGGGTGYAQQPQPLAPEYAEFQAPPMYVEPSVTYATPGYQAQPDYAADPGYTAYAPEPDYTAYAPEPAYTAPQPGYTTPQPVFAEEPSYAAAPAYVPDTAAPQPRYTMEPGYIAGPGNTSYYSSGGTIAPEFDPVPVQAETPRRAPAPYTSTAAPARIEYVPMRSGYAPAEPDYAPAEMSYTPAPVTYSSESIEYMPATRYETEVVPHSAAPAQTPFTDYAPEPETYAPQPTGYSLDPASYQTLDVTDYGQPLGYEFAPEAEAGDPMARRPMPKPNRQPLRTPGYTIVDGVVEYVKDPAKATTFEPIGGTVTYSTMPVNIGTPVEVISSDVPLNTPGTFSAPRGIDVQ